MYAELHRRRRRKDNNNFPKIGEDDRQRSAMKFSLMILFIVI